MKISTLSRFPCTLIMVLALVAHAVAQAPPPPVRTTGQPSAVQAIDIVDASPKAEAAQAIPAEAQKVLQALAARDAGLADAAGLIQKERDAIGAEWTRTIAKLQAAAPVGFELGPNLTYVKKKDLPKTPQ